MWLVVRTWIPDLLQGARSIRHRPTACLAMTAVLGLGIGLTTAVFCLADPFLFRPLPYARPGDLAVVSVQLDPLTAFAPPDQALTLGNLEDQDRLFTDVAAYRPAAAMRLTLPGGSLALPVAEVTRSFFAVLGLPPGGTADWQSRSGDVTPLWVTAAAAKRLVGDAAARGVRLPRHGGGSVEIVGVLPKSFVFPSQSSLAAVEGVIPAAHGRGTPTDVERAMTVAEWTVLVRLRQGIRPATVRAMLPAAARSGGLTAVTVTPLTSYMTRHVRRLALGALAVSLLLFGLCVANFANLLLARTVYRSPELLVRSVLGARLGDLVRLVSAEVLVVAAAAVVTGLAVAGLALAASRGVTPADYLVLGAPVLTMRAACVALWLGTVVVVVGVSAASWLCARVPASVVSPSAALNAGRIRWMRHLMGATQSGLGLLLLLGASVLARSYVNLVTQRTGVSPDAVVVTASYPDEHAGPLFQADIEATLDRLRRVPGVSAAAAAKGSLVDRTVFVSAAHVRGRTVPVAVKRVTPGYFEALGSRVLAGRGLDARDRSGVALVNETFARRHFPDGSVLGQVIGGGDLQIAGVVADMFDVALDRPPEPTVFQLLASPEGCHRDCNRVHYVLRVDPVATGVRAAAALAITGVNRQAAVVDSTEMRERLLASIREKAFATFVLAIYAVTGVGVCSVGLVGIVSFLVSRRTSELAIRMALGATRMALVRTVVSDTLASVAVGVAGGLLVGRWTLTFLSHLSYGTEPTDPWTIAGATLVMALIALVGVLVPAMRTLRLSPWSALRVQ